jgi:nucleoside-diphosphate-sugar epimerase
MEVIMADRVLISGASGFIASHTIARLLDEGFEVVGTVRDPSRNESIAHLNALPGAAERLSLVAADLNDADPFGAYATEVDYVLHMASPYQLTVKDPQRDLVDPAVHGTVSMLDACATSSRVKRVVVTSSMAAITDEPDRDHVLTEADWNEKSTLGRNPYYLSKTAAERAAWDFVEKQSPAWDLIVINPFLVVGPAMTRSVNESNRILADLLNGKFPAIMDLTWGFVDVRDVALAHVRALTTHQANGRYLCAAETRSMREVVGVLAANGFGKARLPKMGMDSPFGNRLALLAAYLQPKGVKSYLQTHIGRIPRFDHAKIVNDLGIEFRSVDGSIVEACRDLADWGHVKPPQTV